MRLIYLPLLLTAVPAAAGELPDHDLVRVMMQEERAPVETEQFLHNPFSLGSVAIDLGSTQLAPTAFELGAVIHDSGKGRYVWACVTDGSEAIWLISETTDQDGEPLITSLVRTASLAEIECTPADLDLSDSLPGLGATLTEIEATMGWGGDPGHERISYRTQDTLGDGGGNWLVISTVTYHIIGGAADAVSYDTVIVR